MTRGVHLHDHRAGDAAEAFAVEAEVFWCERITRLRDGSSLTVYLTPDCRLTQSRRAGHIEVGTYNIRARRVHFIEDCYFALEGK